MTPAPAAAADDGRPPSEGAWLESIRIHGPGHYLANPHRPRHRRPVIAPPPALPMLYPGPSPRTVAEARAVLEGLGRTYRHLSERDTKIVFELYRAARLA